MLLRAGATFKKWAGNVGPAMCLQKLSLAPWAWLSNKSIKLVRVNKLIGAVCESSNRLLSNARRSHGEWLVRKVVTDWLIFRVLKSLKSLTSASTGDADGVSAFRVACFKMIAVYSLIITAPVMRRAVKARQAFKNVEVLGAGFLLLLPS